MKIVSFEEFLKLPTGTVYQEWKPHIMGEVCIKQDSTNLKSDFFYSNITIQPSLPGEDQDAICKFDFFGFVHDDTISRWGMFDEEQLFLLYDDIDVDKMIEMLKDRKE